MTLLLACALLACRPTARLGVRFVAPSAVAVLDRDKLNLVSAKLCPPGVLIPPAPGSTTDSAEGYEVESAARGFEVRAIFSGKSCAVQVTAWYDTDGDKKLGSGDLTGTSPPMVVVDRGIFSGNLTTSPDVALSRVP